MKCINGMHCWNIWVHPFSRCAKFFEKILFLTLLITDKKCYFFQRTLKHPWFFGKSCVRTEWMIPIYSHIT